MKIEFDQAKNKKNIKERGLSFEDVALLDWDAALIKKDTRQSEDRYVVLAPLDGRLYVACYTWRGDMRRIISFRKANKREEKIYETFN